MRWIADDRSRYLQDGYVLVRGLIDTDTLERIDTHFLALLHGEATIHGERPKDMSSRRPRRRRMQAAVKRIPSP